MACLTTTEATDLFAGMLSIEAAHSAREHAAGCADCRQLLAGLARTSGSTRADLHPADDGSSELRVEAPCIGRYQLIEQIGSGGMGEVYSAFDPDLERRVAIKLLAVQQGPANQEAGARLLREAQAIAKVSHPNVVAVHDVGTSGDEVFIAMEFVDGTELDSWIEEHAPSLSDILDIFGQAGRGLAAAHEQGLVHRDFKPANVLVDRERRVRVLDFGLAGAAEGIAFVATAPSEEPTSSLTGLTKTGCRMGTPAYMAPEQHRAETAGPAADQFAFCVALYRVLTKAMPFPGETHEELAANVCAGNIRPLTAAAGVPKWLSRVVSRGLQPVPADRFPTMQQLLAAMGRDRYRMARRVMVVAAVLAALALSVGALVLRDPQLGPSCDGAGHELVGVWDQQTKLDIERAFVATDLPYALARYQSLELLLNDYVDRWGAMHRSACEATHVHGNQSGALLDLRMRCLDRRVAELNALTELLSGTMDSGLMNRAPKAAASLSPVTECGEEIRQSELHRLPSNPQERAHVERLRARLDKEVARKRAGKYSEALPAAKSIVAESMQVEHMPLQLDAMLLLADLQQRTNSLADAEQTLLAALRMTAALDDDARLVEVLTALCWNLGEEQAEYKRALAYGAVAMSLMARLSGVDRRRAEALNAIGLVHLRMGDYAQAERYLREARDQTTASPESDAFSRAGSTGNLAIVFIRTAKYREAQSLFEEAIAQLESAIGKTHPGLVAPLNGLGVVLRALGDHDGALRRHERALGIVEESMGADHLLAASTLTSIGNVWLAKGDNQAAAPYFRRALAIFEQHLGPAHPNVADALGNLANTVPSLQEARSLYERSIAITESVRGPRHTSLATKEFNLASDLLAGGQYSDAKPHLERALKIWQDSVGSDHPHTALAIIALGVVHESERGCKAAVPEYQRALGIQQAVLGPEDAATAEATSLIAQCRHKQGRRAEAVKLAEHSLVLNSDGASAPETVVRSHLVLARILWSEPTSRVQAARHAELAREICSHQGERTSVLCGEVESWHARNLGE